jgi:DNA-binding IclR family transcriptional regulator
MATHQTRIRNIVGREPKTLEEIVRIAGFAPSRVRVAVEKLIARGRLRRRDGGYCKTS